MTDDELKALVASIAIAQKDNAERFRETDKKFQETALGFKELKESIQDTNKELKERFQDTDKELKDTNKQIKELGKQIGGLGRKFGSFTEGLALPSMQKILQEQFKMEIISPSVRVKKQGKEIEIDVLAYANSSVNEVYLVEVKSHLREEGIIQLQKMMHSFRHFFPEHDEKKLYGILAAVDMSAALKTKILSLGFYAATIKEDVFSLTVPDNFKPKSY